MDENNWDYPRYVKDPRIPCKYGAKCYQKNTVHHNKYKHPPKRKLNHNELSENASKRQKLKPSFEDVKEVEQNLDVKEEVPATSTYGINEIKNANEVVVDKKSQQQKRIPEDFDVKSFIKEKFLVDMPPDFYDFWELCKDLQPQRPESALALFGLELVGPFDVLAGKFYGIEDKTEDEYFRHWRYYYDPPELQTVLKGDKKTGFHIGYFRDIPDEMPVLMVANSSMKDGVLHKMGDNIFAAVTIYLENLKNTANPFQKLKIAKYSDLIKNRAKELNLDLAENTTNMRQRQGKTVTRTFNTIGLIVPYNKKTQLGYRELAMSDKQLKALLTKIEKSDGEEKSKYLSELQPVLTFASIALDECDFGTGVELGWDIMAHGISTLNSTALRFLKQSYGFLNRDVFARIVDAHLTQRKQGCNLSVL